MAQFLFYHIVLVGIVASPCHLAFTLPNALAPTFFLVGAFPFLDLSRSFMISASKARFFVVLLKLPAVRLRRITGNTLAVAFSFSCSFRIQLQCFFFLTPDT